MDNINFIGLVATVFFGIVSIWLTIWLIRRKKRPCEILFLATDCINLYNKLSIGLESLELRANNKKIDNDLLFFSGVFVCNGNSDIKGDNHLLTLSLPDKCRWADIKVSSLSDGLVASVSIIPDKQGEANLVFDQFRMGEFINIKGLVECQNKDALKPLYNFHHKISFNHRIEDTEKVRISEFPRSQMKLVRFILSQIPFILMFIVTLFFLFIIPNVSPISFQNRENKKEYFAHSLNNGSIEVWEIEKRNEIFSNNKIKMTPQMFKGLYTICGKYHRNDVLFAINYILYGVMAIFLFFFLVVKNRKYFRARILSQRYLGEN